MTHKVSIVIPYYNCAYLVDALKSCFTQTYKNIEVIVVNDGSTEDRGNINKWKKQWPIIYIEKENGGTASALNAGIRAATGEYVAWLSSDDVFERMKIEKQVKFMEEHALTISHTNFAIINPEGTIIYERAGRSYDDKKTFVAELLSSCFINGSTVMMQRQLFDKVGFFNEKYRFAHDYDFWLRTVRFFSFGYVPAVLTRYRVHPRMHSLRKNNQQLMEARVIRKHYVSLFKEWQ